MDEGEGTPSGCDLRRKKAKQARLRRPLQVVWVGAGRLAQERRMIGNRSRVGSGGSLVKCTRPGGLAELL
jgi:hypothetical protein